MNKIIAIAIVLGLSLMSAVRADDMACSNSCISDQQQCVSHLGEDTRSNCNAGYRVCVQRCNPRHMNTAYLDGDSARQLLYPRVQRSTISSCASNCALSASVCVDTGNGRSNCRYAQQACESRCSAG